MFLFFSRLSFICIAAFTTYAYFRPIPRLFHFTRSSELLHLIGFAGLSFFMAMSFPKLGTKKMVTVLFFTSILAEIAQPIFTKRRNLSINDMAANFIGVLVGICLCALLINIFKLNYFKSLNSTLGKQKKKVKHPY